MADMIGQGRTSLFMRLEIVCAERKVWRPRYTPNAIHANQMLPVCLTAQMACAMLCKRYCEVREAGADDPKAADIKVFEVRRMARTRWAWTLHRPCRASSCSSRVR